MTESEHTTLVEQAYQDGYQAARQRYEIRAGAYRITASVNPGMVYLVNSAGEGGEFHGHDLAVAINRFFMENL